MQILLNDTFDHHDCNMSFGCLVDKVFVRDMNSRQGPEIGGRAAEVASTGAESKDSKNCKPQVQRLFIELLL